MRITMAGLNDSSQLSLSNPTLECLFTALDPKSLILSQFPDPNEPHLLQLTTESPFMERGPRYEAYAVLRESRLRLKNNAQSQEPEPEPEPSLTPPRKQVKFQGSFASIPRKGSSVLAQSVPDFSSVLRKENRKPPAIMLPPMMEKSMTPPAKSSKMYGNGAKLGGSKSANSGEKRNGGLIARKSYACVEDLKGLSYAAASAINNGENRGGRTGRGVGKTLLGYRQY